MSNAERELVYPSLERAAHTLLARCASGVLATLDPRDGTPYPSHVELMVWEGEVHLFLSDLAAHTTNLKVDGRASLLVVDPLSPREDRLARERLTLMGRAQQVARSEALEQAWLAAHPGASGYIGFADFHFYRLGCERARYVAGFGRMGWIEQEAWRAERAAPFAAAIDGIIAHMNEDHGHNLRDYARAFGAADHQDVARVSMVGVDELGVELEVIDAEGASERLRLSFDEPVERVARVREALVKMAQQAREVLSGRGEQPSERGPL